MSEQERRIHLGEAGFEFLGFGVVNQITAEVARQKELDSEEAKTWMTVDQHLIDKVVALGKELLDPDSTGVTFQLDARTTLDVLTGHGLYGEAQCIIDIVVDRSRDIRNPNRNGKRLAGYTFFEHSVTNHPHFFTFDDDDVFVKVTNEEIQQLITTLEEIRLKKSFDRKQQMEWEDQTFRS